MIHARCAELERRSKGQKGASPARAASHIIIRRMNEWVASERLVNCHLLSIYYFILSGVLF